MAIWENCHFNEFVPFPEDIGDNWREWNDDHWGTKWEPNFVPYLEEMEIENEGDIDILNLNFNTAWSPPIEFYEAMTELGFEVSATYREDEGEFAGGFENGEQFYTEVIPSDDDEDEEDVDDKIVKIMERLEHLEHLI